MKKLMVLVLGLVLIISSPSYATQTQENNLKIGDYVYFGEYASMPILWQVIHLDKQMNPLLFAVSSIGSKAFDAAESGFYGEGEISRDSYGSNFWKESNIKDWLNSDDEKVVYTTTEPSAEAVSVHYNFDEEVTDVSYNKEVGFLFGFSEEEKSMIVDTTITTAVTYVDAGIEVQNDSVFTFSSSVPEEAIIGHGSKRKVSDISKVFLLGMNEYYEYVVKRGLHTERKKAFWLRTPEGNSDFLVSIVDQSGGIMKTAAAFSSVGVMPALYLNKALIKVESGIGMRDLPYQLINYTGDSDLVSREEQTYFNKLMSEIISQYNDTKTSSVSIEAMTRKIEKSLSTYYQLDLITGNTIEELLTPAFFENMENSRAYIYEALLNNKMLLNRKIELEPYINLGSSEDLNITLTTDLLKTSGRYKRLHLFANELGIRLDSLSMKKELQQGGLRIMISKSNEQIKVLMFDLNGAKITRLKEQVGIYITYGSEAHAALSKREQVLTPIFLDDHKTFFNISASDDYILQTRSLAFNDIASLTINEQVALKNLVNKGIISGYTDSSFKPLNNITRGEVSKMLNNAFYAKAYTEAYQYIDIYGEEWFAPSVLLLSQEGIIKGYPNGMFKANQSISLQEVYALLSRILKKERSFMESYINTNSVLPGYIVGNWAVGDVALMQQEEIVFEGQEKNLSKMATRMEVVRLVDLLVDALYQ